MNMVVKTITTGPNIATIDDENIFDVKNFNKF